MSPRVSSGSTPTRPMGRRRRKGRSPAPIEGTLELVNRLFVETVTASINGQKRKLSKLEAIIMQLWHKEMSGDARALRVRLRYEALAAKKSEPRLELIFLDSNDAAIASADCSSEADLHE